MVTRREMDAFKVGDRFKYRVYSCERGKYVTVTAKVTNIYECTSGERFAHGGYHSVWIEYTVDRQKWREPADNDLVMVTW